ncbi:hypothetical protein [Bradyrhizobium sp. CCBAU 21362]|uniref:hypothetical protein n=1 Tax=Bradyrhizobium sp. CCBAU 21362 TaxID=1325082 RepID=UPI0023052B23|nr:hypothetical protein [Bradyrhizobium sp. CCBAU 21362]
MSQSTRGVSRDRLARAAIVPQRRHFVFQSRRPRIGGRRLGGRLRQLDGEAIGTLTLALEHGPVGGCDVFEPRDLRLEGPDL